jgi:hypothetical protein
MDSIIGTGKNCIEKYFSMTSIMDLNIFIKKKKKKLNFSLNDRDKKNYF